MTEITAKQAIEWLDAAANSMDGEIIDAPTCRGIAALLRRLSTPSGEVEAVAAKRDIPWLRGKSKALSEPALDNIADDIATLLQTVAALQERGRELEGALKNEHAVGHHMMGEFCPICAESRRASRTLAGEG